MTLPCVAYVGGWGELAYHAQTPLLRNQLNLRQTAFVPRLSATVLEPAMQRSLEKLKQTPAHALQQRGETELEEAQVSHDPAAEGLQILADETKRKLLDLRQQLGPHQRNMEQQFKKLASQVQQNISKLAQRVERQHTNAQGSQKRHARRIQHGLYPRGQPQERVRGPLEICAQTGSDWIRDLIREVEPLPTEHLLIHLIDGDDSHEA